MNGLDVSQESPSVVLDGFDRREREAILEHKYYLGIELGFDPGIVATLESWECRYAEPWRQLQLRCDCEAQVREIEAHRRHLSQLRSRQVSLEEAAHDWIVHYAAQWRHCREGEA